MEFERWHRTEDVTHPAGVGAPPLSWPMDADNRRIEQDAFVTAEATKLGAMSVNDLNGIDIQWLQKTTVKIAQPASSDERIARQRIRLAAIPRLRVDYVVGRHTGQIDFIGRRLLPSTSQPQFFEMRARRLRAAAVSLMIVFALAALAYLGRGAYYWHGAGMSTLASFAVSLSCAFMFIAEATAARRRLKGWAIGCVVASISTIACFAIAIPTVDDAAGRLRRGDLAGAADELSAISSDVNRADVAATWADLHMRNVKSAPSYEQASKEAALIPASLPQHAVAVAAVDETISKTIEHDLLAHDLEQAATAYTSASAQWQRSPMGVQSAEGIYVARAMAAIGRFDWHLAAAAVADARNAGVAPEKLSAAAENIRREAIRRSSASAAATPARERLSARLNAEHAWIDWQLATGLTAPELVSLRTAMAGDLSIVERRQRRHS
jgi:hypothetical protein